MAIPRLLARRADVTLWQFGFAAAMLALTGANFALAAGVAAGWLAPGSGAMLTAALALNAALALLAWRHQHDRQRLRAAAAGAEAHAERIAATDALTGLMNRDTLLHRQRPWPAQQIAAGKTPVILVAGLEQYRAIGDLHGHGAGDALVAAAARRIADALPPAALLARLGADQFAIGLGLATGAEALGLANQLLIALNGASDAHADGDADRGGGAATGIRAAVGLAQPVGPGEPLADLVRRAGIAMSQAQFAGGNRAMWFTPAMEAALLRRADTEAAIRSGAARGEFIPYFEAQVDLATGAVAGFEMLMRWQRPGHGLIQPDDFIAVAERSDQIAAISWAAIAQAMDHALGWDPRLTLAVNIAPRQLADPWFAQRLMKLLTTSGFPPSRLDIELTESALIDNLALVQSTMTSLKNIGVGLSLDDFGTGYSSLSHLRMLPFDRIKIDRSFVTSMADDANVAAMVLAIVRMGDSLGMAVTAEGVESAEVAAMLAEMGCARGQGWHFGRAATPADTRRWLAGNAAVAQRA